jgi:uncharacterized membrane protein
MIAFTQVAFIIIFPAFVIYFEKKSKVIRWLSPIVICYLFGIVSGNLPFIVLDKEIISYVSMASISLAIPLLLFNSNILEWLKHSGKSLLSYILSVISVIISSSLFFLVFKNQVPEAWKVSGMLIGVYTGGTPNMSAIGIALDSSEEIFIILNSSDVFLGAIYFVFLITFSKRLLGMFLPKYKNRKRDESGDPKLKEKQISHKQLIVNILIALVLGISILGFAAWLTLQIKGEIAGPLVILILTTLGIALSFVKKVQRMKGSYETAYFLLLIFSLAIGSLADLNELVNKSSTLFFYCTYVMFGAILLHFILAAIFRIDRDTVIITSTAAIYGPAFIGPIANSIKNKEVIVAGITMGLIGYAIGNYLGIGIALLLK